MTRRQRRRLIKSILLVLVIIFAGERLYNSQEKFQVKAMDAEHYGIVEAKLTGWEKMRDFNFLYDTLEENYPFFKVNERLHGVDWLANKRTYKRIIRNTKNDAEFFVAMDKIIRDLNDGHTNIFDGRGYRLFYKYYNPYQSRGIFWHNAFTDPRVLYRYKFDGDIESIEDDMLDNPVLETRSLIDKELAYMKISFMGRARRQKEDYPLIKEFLKEVEDYDKLIIDIRGNGGGNDRYWQQIIELIAKEPLAIRYHSFFKSGHKYMYDPYAIDYSYTIEAMDGEKLKEYPEEIREDFNFHKSYYVKINPWGKSHNPSDEINFTGKIYLLIDGGNFSSSEKLASFAKDTGFATLVGDTTGGGKVFEILPIISLPKSKLVIRYSRDLVMNADGTINMETKTTPHIEVDPTPHEDFTKDKCIQAVIND